MKDYKALAIGVLLFLGACVTYNNSHIPLLATSDDAVVSSNEKICGPCSNPYTVAGKKYYPRFSSHGFKESGKASWYGAKFNGNATANGETFDMYKMTAAHPTLPLPSYVRVTNIANKKSVIVRVNDRGPFHGGRAIDLSYAAALKIGMVEAGTAKVRIEALQ